MDPGSLQSEEEEEWDDPLFAAIHKIALRQHGRITHAQLREVGLSEAAIKHRVATKRLLRVGRGVYALGRRDNTREGVWMTAVLCAGRDGLTSHSSASELWGYDDQVTTSPEVSTPYARCPARPEYVLHRRGDFLFAEARMRKLIPVTSPALTIIDNARRWGPETLDVMISRADARGHVNPSEVHACAKRNRHVPGAAMVRKLLDRRTLVLTTTELEHWFARILRKTALSAPLTQKRVNGHRVDFYWPDLGLVVETDGGRYHRTPGQQTTDRRREHAHMRAGMTVLRFTHEQVRYAPEEVLSVLVPVAERLAASRAA